MPACVVLRERTFRLGKANIIHHAPLCHVQRYTQQEGLEEMREGRLWRHSMAWDDYARFRIDFARRLLRDGISSQAAADYLEAAAPTWPGYNFEDEIAYYRARAEGKRVCHACLEILPPLPPCDCGCQAPPKPVAGFSVIGPLADQVVADALAAAERASSPPGASDPAQVAKAGLPPEKGTAAGFLCDPAPSLSEPGPDGSTAPERPLPGLPGPSPGGDDEGFPF